MRSMVRKTLQLAMLGCLVASGFGVMTLATPSPVSATDARNYKADSQECRLLAMINKERARKNEPKLQLSASLGAASEHHSGDMAKRQKMYHSDLRKNAEQHGYKGGSLGENVGFGDAKAKPMLNAWMDSSGHRRNILDGGFRAIGIAREKGGNQWYWTTIFGSEADQTVRC